MMDVSKLKIGTVDELPEYCKRNKWERERSELAKIIISAPMGKWMKISGFGDMSELRKAQSGIRNASLLRELGGVRIKTATSTERRELFFMKLTRDENKEAETPKKSEMLWTDGKLRALPAGVYLEDTEDESITVRGKRVA